MEKIDNAIRSTNFTNLKNKELNEGFEESVFQEILGKDKSFQLRFNNRWQKILPFDIRDKMNKHFYDDIKYLKY